jgi:hypothetical protein
MSLSSNTLVDELSKLKSKIDSNKLIVKENIEKLKNIKSLFSSKFGGLIEQISNIPQDSLEKKDDDEQSPASLVTVRHWEWLYANNSAKTFTRDEDLYTLKNDGGWNTMTAYSSISFNSTGRLKVKFHDVTSFGCGGFGIISMNDPAFNSGSFNSSSHPLFCLCCSGTWGAQQIGHSGEAMQHRLKTGNR